MSLRSNISFGVLSALMLASSQGLRPFPAQSQEKPVRPLTGYTVIHVEKFRWARSPARKASRKTLRK